MNRHPDIEKIIGTLPVSVVEKLSVDDTSIDAAYFSMQKQTIGTTLKIVSVIGGFLSTLAFIGFIVAAGLYDSKFGLIIFGLLLIAAAIILNKSFQQIMVDTISISFFIFGCCLFGFGFQELHFSDFILPILFIVIATITLLLVQSFLLAFLSLLLIAGSTLWLISLSKEPNLFHVYNMLLAIAIFYVYTHEANLMTGKKMIGKIFDPLLPAMIVAFVGGLSVTSTKGLVQTTPWLATAPAVVCIILIILLTQLVLSSTKLLDEKNYWKVYVAVALVLAPTLMNTAIAGSLLIVLLTYAIKYITGLGLGILAFIFFVSQFYYDLDFSLLYKSIMLFASGVFFLLIYLFVSKKTITHEAN